MAPQAQQAQQQVLQHNSQVSQDMADIFLDFDKFESHVPGMKARNCIVAAMHFDFQTALTQSNFADPQLKYREEATNI